MPRRAGARVASAGAAVRAQGGGRAPLPASVPGSFSRGTVRAPRWGAPRLPARSGRGALPRGGSLRPNPGGTEPGGGAGQRGVTGPAGSCVCPGGVCEGMGLLEHGCSQTPALPVLPALG